MKGIRVKKLIFPAVCAALGLVLRFGSRHVRGFADAYASHMNTFWVNTLGRLFKLFPFTFAEMAIYAIILAVAVFLIVLLVRLLGRKRGTARYVGRGALFAVTLASLIFFLYEAGEDSYFFRTTFAETYGFGNGSYSTDDLEKVIYCPVIDDKVPDLEEYVDEYLKKLKPIAFDPCNNAYVALGEKVGNAFKDGLQLK